MTATLTQYIDVAGVVETPWIPRTHGKHSDTRYMDYETVPAWFLLKRENYDGQPSAHRKAAV